MNYTSSILKYYFLLFLLMSKLLVNAQENIDQPHAKMVSKFAFTQLTGGLVILHATIDTSSSVLNFLLDTGSGGISLDSTTAKRLGFSIYPTERMIRGIAGKRKLSFTYGHYLNFPEFVTDTFSFHINNYDLISSAYGYKIDGVIGYSFLRKYIVKVDYDMQMVEVYKPGIIKYPRGGHILKPDFTTLPFTYFSLGNNKKIKSRYLFDMGAGLCFLLNKQFVKDSTLFNKRTKFYATQAEGLGGKKTLELAVIKNVSLGPYYFKDVPVYIFDDEFKVISYPKNTGIIGNDLLRRFNLIINYPDKIIYIKPNKKFVDAFDYSYTGLGIYYIDDKIIVTDVIKGSPGDKAGFEAGDIIVAIDNDYSTNIQTVKHALQNAGAKLNVLISRNEKLEMMILDVKNIMH